MTKTTLVELSYDSIKQLGLGHFGTVYSGLLKESSQSTPVAVKQVQRRPLYECIFIREVEIMKKAAHHPNILRIFRTETGNDFW